VALRARKRRTFVSLIDFVIENATVIESRGDVTTLGAATRFHGHFLRLVTRGVHRHYVVTLGAFHVRVRFMSKSAG
jgi:hypothetical protein